MGMVGGFLWKFGGIVGGMAVFFDGICMAF